MSDRTAGQSEGEMAAALQAAIGKSQLPAAAPGDPARMLAVSYFTDGWIARGELAAVSPVSVEGEDEPTDSQLDAAAAALWAWSWTVDQGKTHRPYPYERLIEATKDDLRRYARELWPLLTASPSSPTGEREAMLVVCQHCERLTAASPSSPTGEKR